MIVKTFRAYFRSIKPSDKERGRRRRQDVERHVKRYSDP